MFVCMRAQVGECVCMFVRVRVRVRVRVCVCAWMGTCYVFMCELIEGMESTCNNDINR